MFHTVQAFITILDMLKLDIRAVDQLQPQLVDLVSSLNKFDQLHPEHECKSKCRMHLLALSQRSAIDELSEAESRQLSFDLESAFASFHRFLEK